MSFIMMNAISILVQSFSFIVLLVLCATEYRSGEFRNPTETLEGCRLLGGRGGCGDSCKEVRFPDRPIV